jgi:hypothetical protein
MFCFYEAPEHMEDNLSHTASTFLLLSISYIFTEFLTANNHIPEKYLHKWEIAVSSACPLTATHQIQLCHMSKWGHLTQLHPSYC